MRSISSYIFISILLLCLGEQTLWSQEKEKEQENQTVPTKSLSGIAVGIDLAPFVIRFFDDSRSGLAFSGRLNLKQKIAGVAELGYENVKFTRSKTFSVAEEGSSLKNYFDGRTSYQFGYSSNGSYLRAGLEYNMFNVDEPNNIDNVSVGFRYGYAYQQHESPGYTIGNGYWGDYSGSSSMSSAGSHWIELLFGIRTELFHNVFMGWTVRVNRIVAQTHSGSMAPAVIPGFGKYSGNVSAGFSYTIEYQIPFTKRNR